MNKIIIADNQELFRAGVAKILAAEDELHIVAQCRDELPRLIQAMHQHQGAIVIFSSALRLNFIKDLMRCIKETNCKAIVIAESLESAIRFKDVHGIIYRNTSSEDLLTTVKTVIKGLKVICESVNEDTVGFRVRERLSPREIQVVGFIVQGCRNKQIADRLGTSEQVIKNYLRSIYDKIGVSDRLELAMFVVHHKALEAASEQATADVKLTKRNDSKTVELYSSNSAG
jgi:DNA-binding NarL/FixJ family response regulator